MKNKLIELYEFLEQSDVSVLCCDFAHFTSLSMLDEDGAMSIGIDPMQLDSSAEELCILAHEAGHCATGSFYNRNSQFDLLKKHEYRADVWAILRLCPKERVLLELRKGNHEIWQLAECFSVTEPFIQKALSYYGLF